MTRDAGSLATITVRAKVERLESRVLLAAVTVDGSVRFQTMDGFGSSVRVFDDPHVFENFNSATGRAATVLTPSQQDEVLDRLYVDLGLTRVRPASPDTAVGAGIEPSNDNADPSVADASKFNFGWKNLDAHVEYITRARQRGVTTSFLSPLTRESWMGNTTAADVAEYGEWLMAQVRRAAELGVRLPYLSVANEPSYGRNSMSGEFVRDVIKNVGPRLRAEGFDTMFVTTDDVRSSDAAAKAAVVLADPVARSYVGALATHLYDESVSNVAKMEALADQYGLPLWMTEFSLSGMGSAGRPADPFAWASLMHELISDYDVSAVDYMWGFFGEWEGNSSMLVTLNHTGSTYDGYTLNKTYYTTGQFSRFVDPGAERIGTTSSDGTIKTTAFLNDDGELVIVAINAGGSNEQVIFDLNGLTPVERFDAVRTSGTENWAALESVAAEGSTFAATLPHNSVTTFTAKAGGVVGEPTVAIASLSDTPDAVSPGGNVTLTADGVTASNTAVSEVSFYRESNGTSGLQIGADVLLGSDAAGPYSVTAATEGLAAGTYTYYARATSDAGAFSNVVTTTNTVATPPPPPPDAPPAVLASIRGVVFDDLNGNGTREDGEAGLGGRVVFLDQNENGHRDEGENAAETQGDGSYAFEGLAAGSYRVRQIVPQGWTVIRPAEGSYGLELRDGQSADDTHFANRLNDQGPPIGEPPAEEEPDHGDVAGHVFDDLDHDGVHDAGEPGVELARVFLDANANGRRDRREVRAVTDDTGAYVLSGVPAGDHLVRHLPPKRFRSVSAEVAAATVSVTAGERAAAADFAVTRKTLLQGVAFHDATGNREHDPGEAAQAGLVVFLDLNRNSTADVGEPAALTDAEGRYSFLVDRGSYRIGKVLPAGWQSNRGGIVQVKVGAARVVARDLANRPA